jgi:peptidoglycan/xylan/chitin deacetylase (PgdA/CDA1 family)
MLTRDQVRDLCGAGVEIGAHTCGHPILASLNLPESDCEIRESKERLEELVPQDVRLFAYPNGRPGIDYHASHVAQVKRAGFLAACSTQSGVVSPTSDQWQLPRFTPWDTSPARFLGRLLLHRRQQRTERQR